MHKFANPNQFLRIANVLMPWMVALSACMLGAGLYMALFASPPDYQQGEMVRVMYIHVPSAWLSTLIYTLMALASAVFLVWKHPLADLIAHASAPIGAVFTLITLITGSLWGKPTWGAWWVWDARLTSMLILLFLYMGYIGLRYAQEENERSKKTGALLAVIGFINIPIIKFSVEWWSTLHQPASILRMDGPTIDHSMLWPLLLCIAGFSFFYITLLLLRMKTLLLEKKIQRLQSKFL